MTKDRILRYGAVHIVERQADAYGLLEREPDTIVIVRRERDRVVVFRCPSGCGEHLVINVDPKAGPAWRLRVEVEIAGDAVTLMPSVWRTTGCCAHFVLWRSRVWWCNDEEEAFPDVLDDRSLDNTEQRSAARFEAAGSVWPRELIEELRAEWHHIRRQR